MKVLLIMPTVHKKLEERVSPFWLPPLGLATIAACFPSEVEVEIMDENIADLDFDAAVDIAGISCMTSQANRAYAIAEEFRRRGVTVALGGFHPSSVPEEAAEHADAVLVGEGEAVWPDFLEDYKNHAVKKIYRGDKNPFPLCHLKKPRRELYQKGYQMYNTVQTARGCPFACEFCNVSTFFGRRYRKKPVEEVVAEVKELRETNGNTFFFVDDEITADTDRCIKLFKALAPLGIKWWSQATLKDLSKNKDVLRYARESGCFIMIVGLETINENNMAGLNKGHNSISRYEEQIAKVQESGIYLNPSFTFGLDSDTEEAFDRVFCFLNRNRIPMATFNIVTPLPNTPFYDRLKREGRIFCNDWSKYNMGSCVFTPKLMSAQALEKGYHDLCEKFYSIYEISQRMSFVRPEDKGLIFGFNRGYKEMLDKFGVIM